MTKNDKKLIVEWIARVTFYIDFPWLVIWSIYGIFETSLVLTLKIWFFCQLLMSSISIFISNVLNPLNKGK